MKQITFENLRDFNPEQIFDCGQCFRWVGQGDIHNVPHFTNGGRTSLQQSVWRGVVGNRIAEVTYDQKRETLEIRDSLLEMGKCSLENAEAFWWNYFDLDRDYGAIKQYLVGGEHSAECGRDEVMASAVASGRGIRILNQDRWETLVSFIISQNNNIPRIKKCIESVAKTLGEKIDIPETWRTQEPEAWENKIYYALPTPQILAKATPADLAECRLGYRDKYLIETAKQIVEGGYESSSGACRLLDDISVGKATNDEAIESLRCFCGVGPKVANCVALFCLGQVDSFPLDVWMKRVMNQLYGIDEKDIKTMKKYAREHFAPYGGIAQQYLFYYITHR